MLINKKIKLNYIIIDFRLFNLNKLFLLIILNGKCKGN